MTRHSTVSGIPGVPVRQVVSTVFQQDCPGRHRRCIPADSADRVGQPGGPDDVVPGGHVPGVTNALGVYTLNTTALANGVHTIAWVVTASNGQADGIGSRFFTVANGSAITLDSTGLAASRKAGSLTVGAPVSMVTARADGTTASAAAQVNAAPLSRAPMLGRRGYDPDAPYRTFAIGRTGAATMQGEEMDRFELRLGTGGLSSTRDRYSGYLRVGNALAPLPIGSRLDPETGVFTWLPGVGFLQAYDFVFVRWTSGQATSRQEVRIVINPRGSNRVGPHVVIDTPTLQAGRAFRQPFVVAGWAIDADAGFGTGIDTLHVWAYPITTCRSAACNAKPIFLGATAYGGRRPDVAALFGERFRASGYGLTVSALPPGTYDIAVFAWSTATGGFVPARVVRVTVR